jgi:histidinol-phosphate/aromatic aminotransferase/cobyric acid decarboxylase-like protein
VARAGGTTRACPGSDAARHAAAARAANASVVFVERPSPFEDGASLEALRTLCEGVADVGALVLVDESYGNYLPPRLSAVHLALEVTNLVVLRGLSKAYSLGGLRLGYAVASHPAAARVRAAVPPLGVASLSLRIGRAVLARGDMAGRLRARVSTARAEAAALLDGSGMVELLPSCDALPLLLCRGDAADVQGRLAERGVISKRQPFWCSESGALRHVCRLSVPLEPERIAALRRLLRA